MDLTAVRDLETCWAGWQNSHNEKWRLIISKNSAKLPLEVFSALTNNN